MSESTSSADLAALQGEEGNNEHYLQAVTDMAEHSSVVTQYALYSEQGVKLLDKGVPVDAQLYERLVRHKLRGSIDEQLAVEGMVSVESVLQDAAGQYAQDALMQLLASALPGLELDRLLAPVRALELPHPLAFKLTVMREQRRPLYEHSIRMMLVGLALGLDSGLDERQCQSLATEALLHDIGVLHMTPDWHDPQTHISGARRKELLVHPITAAMLIQEHKGYPPAVAQAVLEHHEYLDGSGYPRGLRGAEISPLGQILLLAEVATGFFEKYAGQGAAPRLSLMLRMNHRKFPPALVARVLPALAQATAQAGPPVGAEQVRILISQLSQAFADWDRLCLTLPPEAFAPDSGRPSTFVTQRLVGLQKSLFESGSHPQQQAEALDYLQGDPQSLAELAWLGREALWQLRSIVDVVHGRWPRLHDSADASDQAVLAWGETLAAQAPQAGAALQ